MGRCLLQVAGLWLEFELGSIVSAPWNKCDVEIKKSSCFWTNSDTHSGPFSGVLNPNLFYDVGIKYLLPVLTGV